MINASFSNWKKWKDRIQLPDAHFPGIYIIAKSDSNISKKNFSWVQEIIYIGMTNSKGGLKSRLTQFDKTLKGNIKHGGADRVLYKYQNYKDLTAELHVSVCAIHCNVKSPKPSDLRLMGKVCSLEYDCFAEYAERFGELPEFNNQKRSAKFSLAYKKD